MNMRRKLNAYLNEERAQYAALAEARPELAPWLARAEPWIRRTTSAWRDLKRAGVEIPDAFLQPYPNGKGGFFEHITESDIKTKRPNGLFLQVKYQLRANNVLREYLRLHTLLPELTQKGTPLKVLELSSGGCGNLEVARHFGHELQVTDFLSGRGSEFTPLHRVLNTEVIAFDGSQLPYEFADDSYDIVICNQAIDAYGPPEDYPKMIAEMQRITNKKVMVIFNPYAGDWIASNRDEWMPVLIKTLTTHFPDTPLQSCPSTGLPAMIFIK